jgi:hypothetical protein
MHLHAALEVIIRLLLKGAVHVATAVGHLFSPATYTFERRSDAWLAINEGQAPQRIIAGE